MKFGSIIASRRALFEKTIAENTKRGSSSKVFLVNHNAAVSSSIRRSIQTSSAAATEPRRQRRPRQQSMPVNRTVFQSIEEIEDEFEKIMSMDDNAETKMTKTHEDSVTTVDSGCW